MVTSCACVASRLLRRNVEVVAVLQDVSSARWLDGLDLKVMQAPVWPATFKRDAERERLSSATFADTLADFGLADAEALRLLMAAWDQLFNLIKPDLVIAEGAPIASLTARGRIPLALVGTGFALPPAEMERFPLLHQASAPVWREEDLLDIVNRALRRIGSLPLDRLPQMFAADVRMVTTFPLLDPYCAQRTEPAEGPFFDRAPLARREEAETVLAYFSTGLDTTRPELIDAPRCGRSRPSFAFSRLDSRLAAERFWPAPAHGSKPGPCRSPKSSPRAGLSFIRGAPGLRRRRLRPACRNGCSASTSKKT